MSEQNPTGQERIIALIKKSGVDVTKYDIKARYSHGSKIWHLFINGVHHGLGSNIKRSLMMLDDKLSFKDIDLC